MKLYIKMAMIFLFMPALTFAQNDFLFQRNFPVEEFAQRRAKVLETIGTKAVALLHGATSVDSFGIFRQNNEFYYLCGIEVPRAYLLLDGQTGRTSVYLPSPEKESKSTRNETDYASAIKEKTGVDAVYWIESLLGHLEGVSRLYTLLDPQEEDYSTQSEIKAVEHRQAADLLINDSLDKDRFVKLIQGSFPKLEIRNLSPIIDSMRVIKSPAEIALLRRAGQLAALSVTEAMRSTEVGVMEYQLDAVSKYIFFVNGARGEGYPSIIAGGPNMWYGHYFQKNCVLNDGDIVLMDHAPDYGYYTSDIGRIWPVNGKYTPWQRELYGFCIKYHKAILSRIRPGRTAQEITEDAAKEMLKVIENTTFSKPIYEQAARRMLSSNGHLSHGVGMHVHDVGNYKATPLTPGMVFAVDPMMRVTQERLFIRIEDTVLVTENGIENLTSAAPTELDDVEKIMKEKGILQQYPPVLPVRK